METKNYSQTFFQGALNARFGEGHETNKLWNKFLNYLNDHIHHLDDEKLKKWLFEDHHYNTVAKVIVDNYIVNGEVLTNNPNDWNYWAECDYYAERFGTWEQLCEFFPVHTDEEVLTQLHCHIFDDRFDVHFPHTQQELHNLINQQ